MSSGHSFSVMAEPSESSAYITGDNAEGSSCVRACVNNKKVGQAVSRLVKFTWTVLANPVLPYSPMNNLFDHMECKQVRRRRLTILRYHVQAKSCSVYMLIYRFIYNEYLVSFPPVSWLNGNSVKF